jgi:ABC-2 type transport system ATP-binding protein
VTSPVVELPVLQLPVIQIAGLRKTYRRTTALDGVELTVQAGEIFTLLGPSGAGKTTTLEICAGLQRADGGVIQVLDADPSRAGGSWRARVGYVAQRSEDLTDLTVLEAISCVRRYYPRARSASDLVEALGLAASVNTRCGRLTSGQRRRLDVALGVAGSPELLLLDEPTTGFDTDARREFWSLIRDLNDDGTTVLLTTHYVDEAEFLADRVGVLAAGRILAVGPAATIGGRGEAAVTVRWVGPHGAQSRQTVEPTKLITELSSEFGGEIPQLAVERPSLREVYARMIERANLARTEQIALDDARRAEG